MFIVAYDGLHYDRDADGVELFRQVERIRVFELRRQQLGADGNDFRGQVHFLSVNSPPRRGGRGARARQGEASREAAPSEAKAQTGWSDRPKHLAELTTPARQLLLSSRATPPLRGGEYVPIPPRLMEAVCP